MVPLTCMFFVQEWQRPKTQALRVEAGVTGLFPGQVRIGMILISSATSSFRDMRNDMPRRRTAPPVVSTQVAWRCSSTCFREVARLVGSPPRAPRPGSGRDVLGDGARRPDAACAADQASHEQAGASAIRRLHQDLPFMGGI